MGADIRPKLVRMLPVTPFYIVIVSNPEEMKIDEFEMTLLLRGYISTKRTSQILCNDFAKGKNSPGRR